MNNSVPATVLAFYDMLHSLITDEVFDEVDAAILVETYGCTGEEISLPECTMESLRKAHTEYHDSSADLVMIEQMSKSAFTDLVPQLRNPRAQSILERFRDNSGTGEATDLYVHIRNVRLLGNDEAGAAIVTLAVDSYSGLLDLLQKCRNSDCQYTHFSSNKKST